MLYNDAKTLKNNYLTHYQFVMKYRQKIKCGATPQHGDKSNS